jgi:putative acetyltransferase
VTGTKTQTGVENGAGSGTRMGRRAAAGIELRRDDRRGPDALAMIGESEAELATIHRPGMRHAFSPAQLEEAGVVMLTAHLDGRVVGCGGMTPCPGSGGGYGELKRIFVTRAARGRRVSAPIVAALEDEARACGPALMRLETGDAGPEAIRAYERLGYRRCGPFGFYVENGSSGFMEKALGTAEAEGAGPG